MKYYLIKKPFYLLFENKEEVLLSLIKTNSIQLDTICVGVDLYDFYTHCMNFYQNDNYFFNKNNITYIHPITKEINELGKGKYAFDAKKLMGFDKFMERYHQHYFCVDECFSNGEWYSYEIKK